MISRQKTAGEGDSRTNLRHQAPRRPPPRVTPCATGCTTSATSTNLPTQNTSTETEAADYKC
ncbi:hypothetical protein J6590_059470 [Homalodisca vitripennis]|nr:hypothetical protein J6590_059470 [Homalodisca vitripennis]